MSRTITSTMKKGWSVNKRNWNEAWGLYIHLSTESFYFAVTIAGVDIEFHIHNLRDIVYDSPKEENK